MLLALVCGFQADLVKEGALAPLITLARSPTPEVACAATAALANLARNPDNRLATIDEGACASPSLSSSQTPGRLAGL